MSHARRSAETAALSSSTNIDSDTYEMEQDDDDVPSSSRNGKSDTNGNGHAGIELAPVSKKSHPTISTATNKHAYTTVSSLGSPMLSAANNDSPTKDGSGGPSTDLSLSSTLDNNDNNNDNNNDDIHVHKNKHITADDDLDNDDNGHARRVWPSVLADGWHAYLKRSIHAVLLSTKLNILLIFFPFACIAYGAGWGDTAVFILSILPLCPLSERIAFVTDELCKYTNETVAGLLSATMGNITELIISLVALGRGELLVVQLSLIGSVLSNLLLVCGCSFLAGGWKYSTQTYNQPAVRANSGLLLLATMGLLFPVTLTVVSYEEDPNGSSTPGNAIFDPNASTELALSRFCSFILLLSYCLMIFYQLRTHASLFEDGEGDDDEDEEPPILGLYGALFWSAVITVIIAAVSEFLVSSIEGAAEGIGIPYMFITTILLPIVGNAAEHFSAVIFAHRNKLDVSLGIVVGSATQIALFVIPFCVIVGLMISQPLTLDFGVFPSITLFMTVIMTVVLLDSGSSDWLKGALMIMAYVVLSASYYVAKKPYHAGELDDATTV